MLKEHIRMASWWITWKDLDWPSPDNLDLIRRRADAMAKAHVNTAGIFGAHFRWDFMPFFPILHDYMATVRTELNERGIRLFDHHSAVLVHRYETREEMRNVKLHSGPHLPFSPTWSAAASWEYHGQKLNDWRELDVRDGSVLYHPGYTAEMFCYNNDNFIEAYLEYVKELRRETGIDGLMSDDISQYMRWPGCGCASCREKFLRRAGIPLPPTTDRSFWANWDNPAWLEWIDMRFDAVANFFIKLRGILPADYPLMSCCSSSSGAAAPQTAHDIRDMNAGCNLVHLELCGNTPPYKHDKVTWNPSISSRIISSLHHLGAADEKGSECVGQGYGFTEPTAGIIWAVNKMVGAACWFSTLKARLGLPDTILATLPDDAEPAATAFGFEKTHPELFSGHPIAQAAVLFPYETRNHTIFGSLFNGVSRDFTDTIALLFSNGISPIVEMEIPSTTAKCPLLILPSALRLTDKERDALHAFIQDGGVVLATGPFALGPKWEANITAPDNFFTSDAWMKTPFPAFPGTPEWQTLPPGVIWNPTRLQDSEAFADEMLAKVRQYAATLPVNITSAKGFLTLTHQMPDNTLTIHCLAAEFDTDIDHELDAMRYHRSRVNLITKAEPIGTDDLIQLTTSAKVRAFSPLTPGREPKVSRQGDKVTITLPEKCAYAVIALT
mgnify:CR=1 FL=1